MLITRLLLVALLVLFAGRSAAGQKTDSANSQRADFVRPFVAQNIETLPVGDAPVSKRWNFAEDFKTDDEFCLTMHTLVVSRKDRSSGEVIAQYTCTPAKRFQTKSAVANPK
jgi:hypothetical protein